MTVHALTAHDQIAALANSGEVILGLLRGVSPEPAAWKPQPEKWSLLEIVCHLCDEERDDFRRRITLTLADASQEWPVIDPEGWARDRGYNTRQLSSVLEEFSRERAHSLAWLRALVAPDWSRAHVHPKVGPLAAGDLLAAWVAHDLLHLRQLANTRLLYLSEAVAPFTTRYATA